MMQRSDDTTALAPRQPIVPFSEHRPASVDVALLGEYVQLMTASARGRLTSAGLVRLDAIYAQAPEIRDSGRNLDFAPRCYR